MDTKKISKQVEPQSDAEKEQAVTLAEGGPYRLPFGQPGINAKTGAISNVNSLWIQWFTAT